MKEVQPRLCCRVHPPKREILQYMVSSSRRWRLNRRRANTPVQAILSFHSSEYNPIHSGPVWKENIFWTVRVYVRG